MSDLFDDMSSTPRAKRSARAGSPAKDARRRRRWRTLAITCFLLMAVTATAVVMFPRVFSGSSSVRDYPGPGTETVSVTIPAGATGRQIAQILHEAGVVATPGAFVDAYTADSRSSSIQPGTFNVKKEMSASGALAALLDPSNKASITVTIPEGFTTWQVYERLASALSVSVTDVQSAAAGEIGLPAEAGGNPEGWFAPLTYTFEPGTTAAEALTEMVAARVEQLADLGIDRTTWEQTLIKASIIEREGNSTDYAKVARVIENRLADTTQVNGLLQMDSTVLYGLGKTGGVPTQAELESDTPYNTYIHAGLPPSPIGSAGDEAIAAAVAPEAGDWLYFVTVNLDTGETKFATTLDEHNQNVQEFRDWLAKNPQR
ncbi:endolytic transglycosylase MltG [Arcanobacterium haemolyticum]|nr:endolytic transglycosylase MltG [Arcanobacterium haemolyticum]